MSEVDKFHFHKVEGVDTPVPYPASILDCPEPGCQQRAAAARRGVYYDLAYIKSRVKEEQQRVRNAMGRVEYWQLILEAKERSLDEQ